MAHIVIHSYNVMAELCVEVLLADDEVGSRRVLARSFIPVDNVLAGGLRDQIEVTAETLFNVAQWVREDRTIATLSGSPLTTDSRD